ncbi:CopG family transcriptional regulator [Tamilnaduibacter salinus]|uniref:CopG family transcriptional regulator n=1 Tax=Tamilnaduibacter salinus TaxID=1484056 RepID=A0A2A2I1U5_9GAMM|nr:CopG family transcriptional regulator [Tamilnaduibacter salinus]
MGCTAIDFSPLRGSRPARDLDLSTARRVNREQKRIDVDFPSWVVEALNREAARIGVTRQSIIRVWLVERLEADAASKALNGDAASGAC